MRKLDFPQHNNKVIIDNDKLDELCNNDRKGKHIQFISPYISDIKESYSLYVKHNGNPWFISPLSHKALPSCEFKKHMNRLYNNPPQVISFFIKEMRENIQGAACPMCGREGNGTIDHYLPKSIYPEYSFFSKNLVPTCDRCNRTKSFQIKGNNKPERPIHPYFDDFIAKRVMSSSFKPDWRAPLIAPVAINVKGNEKIIVEWHINNIIIPSGIKDYFSHLWTNLCESPQLFLRQAVNLEDIIKELNLLQLIEEKIGGTPNSWKACFYHGLQNNKEALNYLAQLLKK